MLKAIVFIIAVGAGFVVGASIMTKDEIMAEAANRLDEDFVPQCVARAQLPPQVAHRKEKICGCMKYEFDKKGIAIGDAFGSRRSEMQEITASCVRLYS